MELRARAATAAEREERNRLTAPVWGKRLTLEQYLDRERTLERTAFAKESMRTWVLERDDGAIVASHESYRMRTAGTLGDGHVEGIASVFVEPPLRGQGFAQTLLRQSLERFRGENAHGSVLWSEVGAEIYAKLGYAARPIRARQWTPVTGAVEDAFARGEAGAPDPQEAPPGAPRRFRIVFTPAMIEWQRERASFYHGALAAGRRHPDTLAGARAGAAWILWSPDYRNEVLMALCARPGTAEENGRLVEALRRAAFALGLPLAELWISPALDLAGGRDVPRDDEIPMIAPLAEELRPEDWIDYGRVCWI